MTPQEQQQAAIAALKKITHGNDFSEGAQKTLTDSLEYLNHYNWGLNDAPNNISHNAWEEIDQRSTSQPKRFFSKSRRSLPNADVLNIITEQTKKNVSTYVIGVKLHHWMQQQIFSQTPSLIKDYVEFFVEIQAERAKQYLSIMNAAGDLTDQYDIENNGWNYFKDSEYRKNYIANRRGYLEQLAAYRGGPLNKELLALASNTFKGSDFGGNYGEEFLEPLKSRLTAIDKTSKARLSEYVMQKHIPTVLNEPLLQLLSRFSKILSYGDSSFEDRSDAYENAKENIVHLLNSNFGKPRRKLKIEEIENAVRTAFDKWFPGLMLEATPESEDKTPAVFTARVVKTHPDSALGSMFQILDAGFKKPKDRGDDNGTSQGNER